MPTRSILPVCVFAWFCVVGSSLSAQGPGSDVLAALGESEPQPKVLMIGIDGLRSDALMAAKTPAIDSLIDNGIVDYQTSIISPSVTSSDTISGPGWTTFLTGTWADQHGVVDNQFGGRDAEKAPHVFDLAKRFGPAFRTASFLCWTPLAEFVTSHADVDVVVGPPQATLPKGMMPYQVADKMLAAMAAPVLENDFPDITFVYFGAVDTAGHRHGFHPSVEEYMERIEVTDSHVGELIDAIERRPTYDQEDWLVVLSSDHGGQGRGHGEGRKDPMVNRVAMIVSGDAAMRGDDVSRHVATVDVVAVTLEHMGVAILPEWKLEGSAKGWLRGIDSE